VLASVEVVGAAAFDDAVVEAVLDSWAGSLGEVTDEDAVPDEAAALAEDSAVLTAFELEARERVLLAGWDERLDELAPAEEDIPISASAVERLEIWEGPGLAMGCATLVER